MTYQTYEEKHRDQRVTVALKTKNISRLLEQMDDDERDDYLEYRYNDERH